MNPEPGGSFLVGGDRVTITDMHKVTGTDMTVLVCDNGGTYLLHEMTDQHTGELKGYLPPTGEVSPGLSYTLTELEESIKRHGILAPIMMCDGEVLDGHHRMEICDKLGIIPPMIPWPKEPDLTPIREAIEKHFRILGERLIDAEAQENHYRFRVEYRKQGNAIWEPMVGKFRTGTPSELQDHYENMLAILRSFDTGYEYRVVGTLISDDHEMDW